MRTQSAAVSLLLALSLSTPLALARAGDLQTQHDFRIPAQPLDTALLAFSDQAKVQVLMWAGAKSGAQSPGAMGDYTALNALRSILSNTGFAYKEIDRETVAIVNSADSRTLSTEGQGGGSRTFSAPGEKAANGAGETRIAQATSERSATLNASNSDSKGNPDLGSTRLDEIVVTAQKREERLQDVPVPVTAIIADRLVDSNQMRLQDYYTNVPGLSMQSDSTTGVPSLSIRGLTTGGQTNPTVGITVDDVPYGSSTFIGGGFVSPDIDPSELSRIEVLRGPQGTLYGVASIGGLLKYVTVDPSTAGLTGFVQGGIGSIRNGDEVAYNVRAAVNVPFGETFAVRASGFKRRDAGYVDNVQAGEKGVNGADTDGGRLSALWKPSDSFSLKLSALLQNNDVHGSSVIDESLDEDGFQQSVLAGTGGYDQRFEAYSANIEATLGRVDLTAVSGYGVNSSSLSYDLTPVYGDFTEFFFGVRGTPYFNDLETTKFSQEIRLSMPIGERLEWLFGAFYTHEKSLYVSDVFATDAATGEVVGQSLHYTNPTKYEEAAAFTDFTWQVTDRFDLQVGGRQSQIKHTDSAFGTGVFVGGETVTPEATSREDSFTYLVTPRLKLSADIMLYARLASGYRSGGPNANALVLGVPPAYDPDETQNYDVGIKAAFFDRTFSIDASLYYIDWKDVQVTLLAPGGGAVYIANGGRARSQGLEFAIESRPIKGLAIAAWVAWNDAELTRNFPPGSSAVGASGDRLPYSSRISGNLSLDQEFALTSEVTGFVGGSISYVGERKGVFQATPTRQDFPSYARTDLRAGAIYGTWTLNLYVNNLTDRRGALTGGLDGPTPTSFLYIQPRTIGLSLTKTF